MRKVRAGDASVEGEVGVVEVVRRIMMESAPSFSPRSRPSQSRMMVGEDLSSVTAMETEATLSQSIGA